MISLVTGYWDRPQAANAALLSLESQYLGLDLEVIIVDDGNEVPFRPPENYAFPLRVVRLPLKHGPKCPMPALNGAVELAQGEYIVLCSIEVLHTMCVLPELRAEIERGGPKTYASPAVWAPDDVFAGKTGRWHVHSSRCRINPVLNVMLPENAAYAFCAMMRKDLFNSVGGCTPEYRDGAGYDDADFLLKLARVGTNFVLRDDLIVNHPRSGCKSAWTGEMFERNKQIFLRDWGKSEFAF